MTEVRPWGSWDVNPLDAEQRGPSVVVLLAVQAGRNGKVTVAGVYSSMERAQQAADRMPSRGFLAQYLTQPMPIDVDHFTRNPHERDVQRPG